MQIDVGLKQTAIWNVARDQIELERLKRLIQLQEAVLNAMKRPPNLVEAATLPGPDKTGQWTKGVRRCVSRQCSGSGRRRLRNAPGYRGQNEVS